MSQEFTKLLDRLSHWKSLYEENPEECCAIGYRGALLEVGKYAHLERQRVQAARTAAKAKKPKKQKKPYEPDLADPEEDEEDSPAPEPAKRKRGARNTKK